MDAIALRTLNNLDVPADLGKVLRKAIAWEDSPGIDEKKARAALWRGDVNDPVFVTLARRLRDWDAVENVDWIAGTTSLTTARRRRAYDLLALQDGEREWCDEQVPVFKGEPAVVIAEKHEVWYTPDRRLRSDFYWKALTGHLRGQGWDDDSAASLDVSSTRVVERLSDPCRAEAHKTKGLVVGYVQSGKTANFTGVIAKAADTGYRLIIVLGGTWDILRGSACHADTQTARGSRMMCRGWVESAGTFVQTRGYHTNRPTEGPAMQIVLDVADEFKPLVDELTLLLRVVTAKVEEIRTAPTTDYAAVERELAARTAAIEAQSHGLLLRAADLDAPRILVGGKLHRRVGRYPATYFTSAGPVVVERSIFVLAAGETEAEAEGEIGEPRAVDPVSLRVGVVGRGWLPHTARAMAFLLQQGTAREAAATASELGRLPYSTASFDHVAHEVGAHFQEHSETIEQALIEAYELPESVTGVSVSLDRVCMPVEEPLPRPVGRPRRGAPKKPVQRVFRQAYCATVTLHDAQGDAVHTIRYGCMPEGDVTGLCDGVCDDVLALLKQRPTLTVTALCDGAHELWGLIDEHLAAVRKVTPVQELIDLWHLLEKLGAAARIHHSAAEASAVVSRWRTALLNARGASAKIAAEITGWKQEWLKVGEETPVHDALTFLEHHRGRLDYARARRAGCPVGSGAVEATCKSLISVRMKRAGARWKQPSADRIIQLRALALSDRWGDAMGLALGHLRRQVLAA